MIASRKTGKSIAEARAEALARNQRAIELARKMRAGLRVGIEQRGGENKNRS